MITDPYYQRQSVGQ